MGTLVAKFDGFSELPAKLKSVRQGKAPFDDWRELTSQLERMTYFVNNEWNVLPDYIKTLLKDLAYNHLNIPSKGIGPLEAFKASLYTAYTIFKGEFPTIVRFYSAYLMLQEAVLTQVERDNPKYQSKIEEVVNQFTPNVDSREVTLEEFSEWVKKGSSASN